VHVLFGSMKVLSFTPQNAVTSVCLHVAGDRAFFVNDPHTKSTIAKMKVTQPKMQPDTVLMVISKNSTPPASEWELWPDNVSCVPGHYFTGDLGSSRLAFHTKGLCPQVQLNSRGIPKTLRMKTSTGSIVIHKLGADASVCQFVSIEFEAETGVQLSWSGVAGGVALQSLRDNNEATANKEAANGGREAGPLESTGLGVQALWLHRNRA
jgi:hypothetical protein